MKRFTFSTLFIIGALLLSSCSMHLGLSKILGGGSTTASKSSGNNAKHVKATHTPPSPSSASSSGAAATQTPAPAAGAGNAITISSTGFSPNALTVKVGTVVTWTNNDTAAESVTSDNANVFDSGSLNPGATYQFTFTQAGTYTYHSTTNPTLIGTILVTP